MTSFLLYINGMLQGIVDGVRKGSSPSGQSVHVPCNGHEGNFIVMEFHSGRITNLYKGVAEKGSKNVKCV